jgi:phage terminase large subunit GpA-like protein
VKGLSQKGKAVIGKGVAVDIDRKNQAIQRRSVLLYPIGSDTSIAHLQGRLRNDQPGPGYMHLGQCSTDQFLAELFPWKRKPKTVKGFTRYEWILPQGEHDEGGDCTRYAYAALQLLSRRYNRATMWDQLEQQAQAHQVTRTVKRKRGTWLQ